VTTCGHISLNVVVNYNIFIICYIVSLSMDPHSKHISNPGSGSCEAMATPENAQTSLQYNLAATFPLRLGLGHLWLNITLNFCAFYHKITGGILAQASPWFGGVLGHTMHSFTKHTSWAFR
jgi:hypothetical protein